MNKEKYINHPPLLKNKSLKTPTTSLKIRTKKLKEDRDYEVNLTHLLLHLSSAANITGKEMISKEKESDHLTEDGSSRDVIMIDEGEVILAKSIEITAEEEEIAMKKESGGAVILSLVPMMTAKKGMLRDTIRTRRRNSRWKRRSRYRLSLRNRKTPCFLKRQEESTCLRIR